MSAFDALDVRGPDSRRKQLVAKLMQQTQAGLPGSAAGIGAGSVAGVGAPTSGIAEGRAFRNATDVRRTGALPITQGANILPSVLARLGVVGHSFANEVSPGAGQTIDVPRPDRGHGGGVDFPTNIPTVPPQVIPAFPGAGLPAAAPIATTPTATPTTPTVTPTTPVAPPTAPVPPATDTAPPGTQLVPLGNGMYYDPVTDSMRGMPSGVLGGSARRLR